MRLDVAVGGAAKLVGKKVRVRVERVLDGAAFATLAGEPARGSAAITAEGLAEKPTRASRSRKVAEQPKELPVAEEPDSPEAAAEETAEEPTAPKKKRTRRGSRGGRNRRKKPAAAAAVEDGAVSEAPVAPKIHVPAVDLGVEASDDDGNGEGAPAADAAADGAAPKKKRTRRGSRGGRRRRKPATVTAEPETSP